MIRPTDTLFAARVIGGSPIGAEAPKVTAAIYARADTNYQFKTSVALMVNGGKFAHSRKPGDFESLK
jgi:hypothetical protein